MRQDPPRQRRVPPEDDAEADRRVAELERAVVLVGLEAQATRSRSRCAKSGRRLMNASAVSSVACVPMIARRVCTVSAVRENHAPRRSRGERRARWGTGGGEGEEDGAAAGRPLVNKKLSMSD